MKTRIWYRQLEWKDVYFKSGEVKLVDYLNALYLTAEAVS